MKQQLAKVVSFLKKWELYVPYVVLVALTLFTMSLCVEDLKKKTLLDTYAEENKAFREKADSAVKYTIELNKKVDRYKKQADKAKKNAAKAQVEGEQSEKLAADLKTYADSLAKKLGTASDSANILLPIKDKIIAQKDTTIGKQKIQISELNTALYKKDTMNVLLKKSNDSLTSVLSDVPTMDNCSNKIIFCKINKPSRRTSFFLGFGSAVALGVLTR